MEILVEIVGVVLRVVFFFIFWGLIIESYFNFLLLVEILSGGRLIYLRVRLVIRGISWERLY